ncbi:unnamed protein product [Schistosoma curassoni]|uniref:ubiquitinyl hydrolase 1 n=1 Tax=Schistosoma curassoni TaxID=6186 RepID=A0A183K946_9TREM|nr:unnamed protein product [Schistosoma curassoni]CAH8459881.1 unnamed protein product [Schistosoma haematobium]CAH8465590.1 unnamed protein product [Schistosoma bovis]VDP44980.1 unnamed protein product [Schistosoma curassoni]
MVSEGGLSSGGGSSLESSDDSDIPDSRLDNLVDDIIGKLSLYTTCEQSGMTIKNRKDRLKSERDPPGTSTNSRHSFGYKPYPYSEERKDILSHRNRHRCSHHEPNISQDIEAPHSPLTYPFPIDASIFPSHGAFTHPQRLVSQQHESLNAGECRPHVRENKSNQVIPQPNVVDDGSGNNSEDEYYFGKQGRRGSPTQPADDCLERLLAEKKGWKLIKVGSDGACLFRSVSHQIFGDEEKHDLVRSQVIDYMVKNKEHFSQYLTEDFDHYISRKRDASCYGNHVEIQAIAELYNRPVEIYHGSVEPINVFHADYSKEFPIRLSYHGRVHYNSIVDPFNPSFGHGLGMPNYQPSLAEPDLIACAIRESESTHLEEAMLRDKLAETEQDAINRCIEDQAVRESYFDYFNQISVPKVRDSANSLSTPDHLDLHGDQREATLTSGFPTGLARSFDVASSSKAAVPDSKQYRNPANEPLPSSSHSQTDLGSRHIPPNMLGMEEDDLVAMVMEQSRREYLESMRNKQKPHFTASRFSPESTPSDFNECESFQKIDEESPSEMSNNKPDKTHDNPANLNDSY